MKRKIVAILAADIAGYSRLVAEDEEETLRRLETYRAVFSDFIARFGGRVFNTAGDATLAEFQSAVDAVRCAVDVQESVRTRNLAYAPSRQMSYRIGITIGDVVERDGDLLGDGVNIASRLESIAPAGGICISRSVYEAVANKISLRFSDVGEQQLKNIPERVHAYTVALDQRGTSGKGPPQISASLKQVGGALAIVMIAAVAAAAFVLSRSGAPVESPVQSIAPKPGAGEQVAAARDSRGTESPSAARSNADAKAREASALVADANPDSRANASPRADTVTPSLSQAPSALPDQKMNSVEQAAEVDGSCSKYLPSIGRTVRVPCEEDVKKPEPAEGVQAPEHACDRLAGEAVITIESIQAPEALAACRAAVQLYPETRRFKFQLARVLDRSAAYEEALQLYRPLAEAGYSKAISNLGRMYLLGQGVAKDDAEAVRLFRQAAEKGNGLAMNNLGWMYRDGRGVAKDDAEAVRLFRQAAEKGATLAMANLGLMYAEGRGVAKDDAEAVRWYRKAAEAGLPVSMNNLGRMYAEGRGVAKDDAEGVRLFRQAAEKGNAHAMRNLGLMYALGRGVTKDEAEAGRWIFLAIKNGDDLAISDMTTNAAAWSPALRDDVQRRLRDAGLHYGPR